MLKYLVVEFAGNSEVTGDLKVEHILGEDGTNSLEVILIDRD